MMKQNRGVFLWIWLLCGVAMAQTKIADQTPKKEFKLEVKETPTVTISLQGQDIPLPAITSALAQKLHLPITFSSHLQSQRVTIDVVDYSLEETMRLLAPRPVLDSVVCGNAATPVKYLAIYLLSFEDVTPEPRANPNAAHSGAEGSFDLEDEAGERQREAEKQDEAIRVQHEHGLVSISARQQSLLSTLTALAKKMKVICEVQGEAADKVDVEFSSYSWPAAARALSPRLQLYLRQHLQSNETHLWRMVLTAPAAP